MKNSYRRDGEAILWWSHDVVARSAEGVFGRRSTLAPCRGGSAAPTPNEGASVRACRREGTRAEDVHQYRCNLDAATVINRGLYRWRCADGG